MSDDDVIERIRNSAEQAARDLAPPILTEQAIAQEFVDRNESAVRFDHTVQQWRVLNAGGRWVPDKTRAVFSWTRATVQSIACDQPRRERMRLGSLKFARGVEGFAQTDQRIAVTRERWDCNGDIIGTPTGIVDLRSGEFFDPAPEEFITRAVAVDPDIATDCPRWLRFLNDLTGNDDALKRFLQQYAGYALTGSTVEQKLCFIHGPGGTGKSTFANTLLKIMSDYATGAAMETFANSQFDGHPEQLARLDGARLVVANETEAGHRWRENRIKMMTGGDPITARFMRENSFVFTPQFKLLLLGNHAPTITNLDTAIRRRFLIVPFVRKPAEPDFHLEEILAKEWPGILRWMIQGSVDWYSHGLILPKAVTEATTLYFDEQDVFRQWLDECCDADPQNHHLVERSVELFASWSAFAKRHGEEPGHQASFNQNLRARGFEVRQLKQLGTRGCRGIRLKLQAEDRYQ